MQQGQSSDDPVVPRARRRTPTPPAPVRVTLLLLAVVVAAWLGSLSIAPYGLVPAVWPAGGLAAGMLLVSPRRWRLPLVGVVGVVGVLAHVGVGLPFPVAALG